MESTYASKEDGGGMDFNCIPELTTLAEENTNFSNSDKLGGGYPAYGGTWTMAGIFSQTSGIPIKNSEQTDDVNATLAEQSSFSSQARNLEDILADEGYNQCFMIGSDATLGEEEHILRVMEKGKQKSVTIIQRKKTDRYQKTIMCGGAMRIRSCSQMHRKN